MDSNWLEELELYSELESNVDLDLEMIASAMEKAKNVTVLTGAGISVESGVPDFRSENGLWKKYDPSKFGSLQNFKKDPHLFWEMSNEIHCLPTTPSRIHEALSDMEKMGVVKTIVTQNVDGLHQVAGSKHVVEMHGTGRTCYCLDCDFIAPSSEEIWGKTESPSTNVPRCPKCGGLLKLDVILFGEKLNRAIYNEALKASTETDFLLVIGTSLQVAPCNIIPFRAKHCGAQVAFINCTKTPLDEFADFIVRGDAQEYLPKIYKIIKRIRKQKRNSIKHAIKLSFSFAIVLMSMFVTFCNTTFHTNVKLPSFDDKSTDVPILDEYEPNLRRHSIPETEY